MPWVEGFTGVLLAKRGDEILARDSSGTADLATGEDCSTQTRFQVASVSKQLVAAVVMLLVEQDLITLNEPIGDLSPLPDRWARITLHQLLTHTSGLGHWKDIPDFDVTVSCDPDEILDRLAGVPLLAEPGQEWRYSFPGYLVAARVIERLTGRAYHDVLTDRVLVPAGMTATVAGEVPPTPVAWGYRDQDRVDVPALCAIPGTGDVWSTVDDLARYTTVIRRGELLSAEARAVMTSAHARIPGSPITDDPAPAHGYGYGYFLGSVLGHAAYFHPGDVPGYRTFLAVLPEADTTIVVLSNADGADVNHILRQVGHNLDAPGARPGCG